jgi:hypothetical protein
MPPAGRKKAGLLYIEAGNITTVLAALASYAAHRSSTLTLSIPC